MLKLLLGSFVFSQTVMAGTVDTGVTSQAVGDNLIYDPANIIIVPWDHKGEFSQAETDDLILIAEAKGLTLSQSKWHRGATHYISQLANRVATEYPKKYVGASLSELGVPSLYIKGEAPQALHDEVGVTIVDHQPYSLRQLKRRQGRVHRLLQDQGYDQIRTSFDVETGTINAVVTGTDVMRSAFPVDLKSNINITVQYDPVLTLESTFGGIEATVNGAPNCTTGWVVENSSGMRGVTTAGHCGGINGVTHWGNKSHSTSIQDEHRGEYGDIEWHTTSTSELPYFYFNHLNQVRRVESIEPVNSIVVGESICVYGVFTNARDCSLRVLETNVTCTGGGFTIENLVRMDGDATMGGDSGGGWSWGGRAYGSHVGDCGGNVFMPVDLFDEALGVSVVIY